MTPTPLPTLVFDSAVSYSDMSAVVFVSCITGLMLIAFISWTVLTILNKRTNNK